MTPLGAGIDEDRLELRHLLEQLLAEVASERARAAGVPEGEEVVERVERGLSLVVDETLGVADEGEDFELREVSYLGRSTWRSWRGTMGAGDGLELGNLGLVLGCRLGRSGSGGVGSVVAVSGWILLLLLLLFFLERAVASRSQ